ncbi:MAG: acetyltransferase [Planctomycetota bacterium]
MYLIGASGHGKVIAEILLPQFPQLRVLDSDPTLVGSSFLDRRVEDEETTLESLDRSQPFFVSIGEAADRRTVATRWEAHGHQLVTAIHESAVVSPSAQVAPGACVMARAVLQAESRVGRGAIVNTAATIDHDTMLGDFVHIAPGAHLSGNVAVGSDSWIGVGAIVKEGIQIAPRVLVGAGSVVVEDLPENIVAYGNPCRIVRSRDSVSAQ